jgi:hypothetical protein
MCKHTPIPIVKGNSFGNFNVPRSNVRLLYMDALYASAVGSLTRTQIRSYPDIVHVSGLFLVEVQSRYRSLEWS